MFAFSCHIVVCNMPYVKPYPLNITTVIEVSILDSYNVTKQKSPVGNSFLAAALNPAGIPLGIFRSLASIIGINSTKTKQCPFCDETIRKEACSCSFCDRVLMMELNLKRKKQ